MFKNRIRSFLILLFVIFLGLATRKTPQYFSPLIVTHAGDILYTVAVYFACRIIAPRCPALLVAASSLLISFGVETSQLIQWDWLVRIRSHWFGRLILGQGFLWEDLIRYTFGAIIAFGVDKCLPVRSLFPQKQKQNQTGASIDEE